MPKKVADQDVAELLPADGVEAVTPAAESAPLADAPEVAVGGEPVALEPEKCPFCASTIFQGPFVRGPIVNGEVIERERLFQCMGCNQVMNLERIRKPI